MAKLLYGSGLRLMECVRLRVQDLDFAMRTITVRDGKGHQDRVTMLPDSIIPHLQEHLQHVRRIHEQDLANGYGAVYLPDALERKYPNANKEWGWQYVSPADHCPKTHAPESCAAITCTKAPCKRPSAKQRGGPA